MMKMLYRFMLFVMTCSAVQQIVGIDQKLMSLKASMEKLAEAIKTAPCRPQYKPSEIALATEIAALQLPGCTFSSLFTHKKCDLNELVQNYLKQNFQPSYVPSAVQVILDQKSALDNALMAGLFIDEFADPITATHVAGLASYIYRLLVDSNRTCNGVKYAAASPYNDLVTYVKNKFNTSTILAQTATQLLNQTVGTDRLLRSLTDDEYNVAAAYWSGPSSAEKTYVPAYSKTSINEFDLKAVPSLPVAIDKNRAIYNKINSFRQVTKQK